MRLATKSAAYKEFIIKRFSLKTSGRNWGLFQFQPDNMFFFNKRYHDAFFYKKHRQKYDLQPFIKICRVSKTDPRYQSILTVFDFSNRSDAINVNVLKEQKQICYTTTQTQSVLIKEILLLSQLKYRQFSTVLNEFVGGLTLDLPTWYLYESFINKQGSGLFSSNFFSKEKSQLDLFYNYYLNTIINGHLNLFIKVPFNIQQTQKSTLKISQILPQFLNTVAITSHSKNLHVFKDNVQNFYADSNLNFNTWFMTGLLNVKAKDLTLYGSRFLFSKMDLWMAPVSAQRLTVSQFQHNLRKNRFKEILKGRNFFNDSFLAHYRLTNFGTNIKENIGGSIHIGKRQEVLIKKLVWKNINYKKVFPLNTRFAAPKRSIFSALKKNHVYSIVVSSRRNTKKINVVYKKGGVVHNTAQNILYLLFRLEEKVDKLPEGATLQKVIRLYNLLKILLNEKYQKFSLRRGLLLSKKNLLTFRKIGWKPYFRKAIFNLVKNNKLKAVKFLSLTKKLLNNIKLKESSESWVKFTNKKSRIRGWQKVNSKINAQKVSSKFSKIGSISDKLKVNKVEVKIKRKKKRISQLGLSNKFNFIKQNKKIYKNFRSSRYKSVKFLWNVFIRRRRFKRKSRFNDKIRITENYTKLKENRNALGLLINKKVNFFFINALALTKYAYNVQRKWDKKPKRSPNKYLQNLERDLINKYKYVAIYIKDFIRICFIGMFLKKPTFIARFIAFLIAELPKNRKETTFLRCVMKIVRIFSAERGEIVGLRIKFKGRVNRWRRTKALIGKRGFIATNTISKRIIYGTAHAINRKGAIGIGLWIYYKPEFTYKPRPEVIFNHIELSKASILNYIKYSQKKSHYLENYKRILFNKA
jgi:ribosomal protein S3